jgi:hypothetical protein
VNAPEQGFSDLVAAAREEGRREVRDAVHEACEANAWWHTGGTPCVPRRAIREALAPFWEAYGGGNPVGSPGVGMSPSPTPAPISPDPTGPCTCVRVSPGGIRPAPDCPVHEYITRLS